MKKDAENHDALMESVSVPENADRRAMLRVFAAGMAAGPLQAWFGSGLAHAQGARGATVRLGYQFHLWGAPAVVALKKDLFKASGVRTEDRRFSSGVEARNAMIAGSIDVGTVGMTPFVLGASQGNLIGIAAVCYAGKTAACMVKAGSGISKVADLKGKKIASQVGSTLDNVFKKKIAPEAGLGEKDYSIANVQFSDQVAALAAGSVDAFLGLEPFCSIAEYRKLATPLTDYYKYDIIPNMLAVTSSFAEKNPDACVAFMRAWLQSVNLFQKNPDEVAQVMVGVYRESGYEIPVDVVKRILGRLIVNPDFIPELRVSMKAEADALKAAGRLERIPDPDKVLVGTFLQKARAAA